MGRRSVWSKEKLIELTKKFVPVADEVYRLQRDAGPECRVFRKIFRGTEEPSRGTMQGIYVCTAGGARLAGRNSLNADLVAKMLEGALEKWDQLSTEERSLPVGTSIEVGPRWEDSYPSAGLVLVRTARDLPKKLDPAAAAVMPFNPDQVWFAKKEARGFLPDQLTPGQKGPVSRLIVERLTRFHLVDNVHGQTIPYAPSEVTSSKITSEVTGQDGDLVEVQLSGTTKASSDKWLLGGNYWKPQRDWPHGVATKLLGRAVYDRKRGVFTKFEMVALGERWGRTQLNGRAMYTAAEPIGFEFSLAAKGARIAPTFINMYGVDWVKDPYKQ